MPLNTQLIRLLRESQNLTQAQAAERAGLPGRARWNDIENGRVVNLTVNVLERVADALRVTAPELLSKARPKHGSYLELQFNDGDEKIGEEIYTLASMAKIRHTLKSDGRKFALWILVDER